MSVTYGMDIKSGEDTFLRSMLEGTDAFAVAVVPGKFLVDTIPIRASRRTRTTPASN